LQKYTLAANATGGKQKKPPSRGGARNLFFFSLLEGGNHANLYKNLIKIQMFNVNLGTGARPLPPPVSAPAAKCSWGAANRLFNRREV